MLARIWACVCLSVRLSHASTVLKRLHGLSWFFSYKFFSTSTTLCFRDIKVSKKQGHFHLKLCPNSGLRKFVHSMSSVAKRYINKRPALVCYRQHLATTADVAQCFQHQPTIVACWSHSAYSTTIDWNWREAASRGPPASADIYLFINTSTYCITCKFILHIQKKIILEYVAVYGRASMGESWVLDYYRYTVRVLAAFRQLSTHG